MKPVISSVAFPFSSPEPKPGLAAGRPVSWSVLRGTLVARRLLLVLAVVVAGGLISCEDYREPLSGKVTYLIPNDVSKPGADLNATVVKGPMVGIQIEVKSLKDGSKRYVTTDCDGQYRIADVRYGPNSLRTWVQNSIDILGPDGNVICPATSRFEFFDSRPYFIDILKDRENHLDLVVTRYGRLTTAGLAVKVRDESGAVVTNARVDLYRGTGASYILAGTRSACPDGNYIFYALAPDPTRTPEPTATPTPEPDPAPAPDAAVGSSPAMSLPPPPVDPGCLIEVAELAVEEFIVEDWRAEVAAEGYRNATVTWTLGYYDVVEAPQYTATVVLTRP